MEGAQGPNKYAEPSSTVERSMRKLREQAEAEKRQVTTGASERAGQAVQKQFQAHASDRQAVTGGKAEESTAIAAMRKAMAAEQAPVEIQQKTAQVFAKYTQTA